MSDAVVPAVVVVPARTIEQIAEVAVKVMPTYKIRKTNSTTFRCLTPVENEKVNWKKGLVYLIARYSKGVNLEMWMYSTKGGAHLAEYNGLVRPLAVGAIKCETLGHALKLRLALPDAMPNEAVTAAITEFMTAVEPTLQAIREKLTVVVSEKKTAEAPAAEPVAEAPVPEVVPDLTVPPAEEPVSKRQAKKAAKAAKAA